MYSLKPQQNLHHWGTDKARLLSHGAVKSVHVLAKQVMVRFVRRGRVFRKAPVEMLGTYNHV